MSASSSVRSVDCIGERKNEEKRVRDIQVRSEQDVKANLFSCHARQANGRDSNGRSRVGETPQGEHFRQEADGSNLAARPALRPGRHARQGFGRNCTANRADRVRSGRCADGKTSAPKRPFEYCHATLAVMIVQTPSRLPVGLYWNAGRTRMKLCAPTGCTPGKTPRSSRAIASTDRLPHKRLPATPGNSDQRDTTGGGKWHCE